MQNVFSGEAKEFISGIEDELTKLYGTKGPRRHGFDPHFTLKYPFETDEPLDNLCSDLSDFSRQNKRGCVDIKGFGSFKDGEVFYAKLFFDAEANKLFIDFIEVLKKYPFITWQERDGVHMNFRTTLAVDCLESKDKVNNYLSQKNINLTTYFDNITIYSLVDSIDGVDKWKSYQSFSVGGLV